MDCRTARDILDVVRPGAVDPDDKDVAAAAAHLENCDDCLLALRSYQALDRRIGRAVRDVPVPQGLRERLHAVLEETAAATVIPSGGDPETVSTVENTRVASRDSSPAPLRRLHWTQWVAVAAAIMLLAGGLWFLNRDSGPRASLARVYAEVPLDPSRAEPFDGNFEPVLPTQGWVSRVTMSRKPVGSDLQLGGEHVVALYRFRFRGRDGAEVYGILAVAPAREIDTTRPLPSSFEAADADYPGRRTPSGQQLGGRAWESEGFVYVCILAADRLDELGQLLDVPIG